jgi:putative tricarboxylic transport membrane protein
MAHKFVRTMLWLAALSVPASDAWSQPAWRPEKPTEIVVTTAPGGSNDLVARAIQKIWQDEKLVTSPVVILNRPGGNQTVAMVYLTQHPGDPHYLLLANPTVVTNHIVGISSLGLGEFTPIANLLLEHTAISVRADSPVRNLQDLAARLKADPDSMVLGIVARGGVNHLALSQAVKAAGVDVRKIKAVIFKTNAESMIALVGGHIQMVASSVTVANAQAKTGGARIIGVAAAQRLGGSLADVPTFKEQGVGSWISNWRAILGPKGLTPAQVAFWEEALAKMAATDEWKKQAELYQWGGQFMRSRDFAKYLEAEYAATRAIMAELGLAKQQ